jgi:23S rRNA pseudouridine2605 synthase
LYFPSKNSNFDPLRETENSKIIVLKRPGNSRDDKSSRSPKRTSKGDDQSKGKPSGSGSKLQRNHYSKDAAGLEKSSPSVRKRKPYSGRPDSGDSPAGRGTGRGAARSTSEERPKRSFSGESTGGKKSFSPPKSKPYSGRPTSDDRPKRSPDSYRGDGESTGEKRAYKPRTTPYSGRPTSDDRPKRSFDSESSGEKKSFKPRTTPYSGRPTSDDRPKRSSEGYRGSNESTGERKFTPKPGGFRKRSDSADYKPFRKSENSSYNKPSFKTERSAEDKPLRSRKKSEKDDSGLIRLNRYISNAGICSRRKADELIAAGVVSVNGEVVSELGHKVDPAKDSVRYNGELLKRERMVYVLLNKPKDYITTTDDPQERRTVMHLVEKASKERIYPIGRLDRNTTGLLLMTNDGDLADKLSHPKNNITKLYQVELNKSLTQGDLNKIAFGLELEDGLIKPDSISYVQGATKKEVGIQIHSGKNRIVRRIFEHLGYEVMKLDRSVYANLTKKDLPRGRWRYLDEKEIIQLKHLI